MAGAQNSPNTLGKDAFHTIVIGVNHLTGSVDLRDKLLVKDPEIPEFSKQLLAIPGMREVVVLSTCNRSEIYAITSHPEECRKGLEKVWADKKGISEDEIRNHCYFHVHKPAIAHLFRVISSLDSLVLGEMQIFGQLKEAYAQAVQNQTVDFYFNHIFQTGLHTGKRVHSETSIHEGAVSISYAAVELAKKVLGNLPGRTVGLVGAGEMGELAAQHLHRAGVHKFIFFNRSLGSAEKLAAQFGGQVSLLQDLPKRLYECDILISATGSPDIVIHKQQVQDAVKQKNGNPLFLIDIAAPRDIDPQAGSVYNVFLFSIDDLKNVVHENVNHRKIASEKAQAIIEEELVKVENWFHSLEIIPLIRKLREKYEKITSQEITKWAAQQSPEVQKQMEAFGKSLMQKFLHPPTTGLKQMGELGESKRASYYAEMLFSLNEEKCHDPK